MLDYVKNAESIYQPGPYWRLKTVNAFRNLKEFGISGFRGDLNGAASSYGDNPLIDLRSLSNYGIRSIFAKFFKYAYPFNRFFNSQVRIARNYFEELNLYKTEYLKTLDRLKDLFSRYKIPSDTTKGGCLVKGDFDGKVISEVDLFYNANSFVEMPEGVVRNYANHVERILKKEVGVISMISYDGFNSSTIDPDFLPKFFNYDFNKTIVPTLTPGRFNYQYISN